MDLKFSKVREKRVCADVEFSTCTCPPKTRDQLGCPLLDPCNLPLPLSKRNREMRGGIERAYGCIRFRGAGNSGPEAGFDHVNVHNRGPEGEK